jgi:hypothetical protein
MSDYDNKNSENESEDAPMELTSTPDRRKQALKNVTVKVNPFIQETTNNAYDVLNELNKISVVTPDEVQKLTAAKEFIFDSYINVPSHRTMVDKVVGVLTDGNFPTPDAKFWQCKKEAEVQFRELLRAYNAYQRGLVDMKEILYRIELAKQEMESPTSPNVDPVLIQFDVDRLQLKLQDYSMKMKELEKEVKYRIEELSDWYNIAEDIKGSLEYSDKNYNEHEVKRMFAILEHKISQAKQAKNEKAEANFTDQLNTLKRLLVDRAKKVAKEETTE